MQYHIVNLCLTMIEQEWDKLPENVVPKKNVSTDLKPHYKRIPLKEYAIGVRWSGNATPYQDKLATCYFLLTQLRPFF